MSIGNIKNNIKSFSEHYDLPLTLRNFIDIKQIPLSRIYRSSNTFTSLCIEAVFIIV